MSSPLAGKAIQKESLIDIEMLEKAYRNEQPSYEIVEERVSFGTSGHRGKATEKSFNDLHVAAITQAICDGRSRWQAEGYCFVGHDTHALSSFALETVLEVLAGNGVVAMVDNESGFVPTPSLSRALLRENAKGHSFDGILITPSHNPPDNGGIKYNPPHGGPAEEEITKWIEERANFYIQEKGKGIQRISNIPATLQQKYDYKGLYVSELQDIIDIDKIGNLSILVDALGGSGAQYWKAIKEMYHLNMEIIHDEYDPTFSFMRYDHDGAVRMDCSSSYAMAGVIESIGEYDIAVGNDPDYDRYGIVTKEGMVEANAFMALALEYLFTTRSWEGKGVGKSIVVTQLVDRIAEDRSIPVYETPVGFKYFVDLLYEGKVALAGEESAGGSFLMKDGRCWTTDKDGIIMALLAMEIMATTKENLLHRYNDLQTRYGHSYTGRYEAACNLEAKKKLKSLQRESIEAKELGEMSITDIRSTSKYKNMPIGGVYISTKESWLVARPSGTEPLYKIYGESFVSQSHLELLLEEGQKIVNSAINK